VGDHAVRIAEHTIPIMETPLDKKTLAVIKKASAMSLEIFDRSILSFFNLDLKEANRNIESIAVLINLCGEIDNIELKQNTLVAISLNYIGESIRRAGEYAGDISETVINLLVEQEGTPKKKK
jgi:phosphate uptake regulator